MIKTIIMTLVLTVGFTALAEDRTSSFDRIHAAATEAMAASSALRVKAMSGDEDVNYKPTTIVLPGTHHLVEPVMRNIENEKAPIVDEKAPASVKERDETALLLDLFGE